MSSMALDLTQDDRVQVLSETGCWIWMAGVNGTGYPTVQHEGKTRTVHRLVMSTLGHKIDGLCVCHKCDIPTCVNPDHLFVGTWGDNNRDREAKGRGRQPAGSAHGMAKIDEKIAAQIFLDNISGVDAAKKYGVSVHTVHLIRNRKQWRCATDGLIAPTYLVAPKTRKNLRECADA